MRDHRQQSARSGHIRASECAKRSSAVRTRAKYKSNHYNVSQSDSIYKLADIRETLRLLTTNCGVIHAPDLLSTCHPVDHIGQCRPIEAQRCGSNPSPAGPTAGSQLHDHLSVDWQPAGMQHTLLLISLPRS
jgi:hypothetical protein